MLSQNIVLCSFAYCFCQQQIADAEITGTHRMLLSPENYSNSSALAYKHYELHVFYTQELTKLFHSRFFHKSFRSLVLLFTTCSRREFHLTAWCWKKHVLLF